MSKYRIQTRRVGEPSSKYGYCPEQFERDVQAHHEATEILYADFKQWMIDRNVTPDEIRPLFLRFVKEFYES